MFKVRDICRGVCSSLASSARLWRGTSVIKPRDGKPKAANPITLYDREGCPNCRLVREALTELDIDANIIPVAKGDKVAQAELISLAGSLQVPYIIDENTDISLHNSRCIVNYLYAQYGDERLRGRLGQLFAVTTSKLATSLRQCQGIQYQGSEKPTQPLELYSFESSPYCRPVRERLTELGLPYILRNLGKQQLADMGPPFLRPTLGRYKPVPGSKRAQMLEELGRVQLPYLVDPNTNDALFESWDIIDHLNSHYTA